MSTETGKIAIRDIEPTDSSFLFSTWKNSLYYTKPYRHIPRDIYNYSYDAVITKILNRPNVEVKVACLDANTDIILGYIAYEPKILHWIYVKEDWRRLGIAKRLFPAGIKASTHITELGSALMPDDMVFNPFILNGSQ